MESNKAVVFISIVIPVYNEEKRIEAFLMDVVSFLARQTYSYEVIIVNDGSIDATVKLTKKVLGQYIPDKFRILELETNQGKGAAVKNGMLAAQGEYVFFLDADGSTAIDEIDNFIPTFSPEFDIYIAVRTKKHFAPFKRVFFGRGYIKLANFLLGLTVSDFTCGFKCYRLEVVRKIFSRQQLKNWSFDAENLYLAQKEGCRTREIPVYWKHVGGSKVRVLKNIIVCGWDLIRIRYYNLCGKYN
jgi:dolichyl-phosphate beta-glucosyltransferase